ncbi:MAG: hypothetical protein ACYCS7_14320 [Acidimicrobiales bacterium]
MLALDSGRPAQLEAAHRALSDLEVSDQLALGFATFDDGEHDTATYRQTADTFSVMCKGIDPTPVPSFRDVAEDERAAHLEDVRAGIDAEAKDALLHRVIDSLIEQSVPEAYKSASSSLAIDWTDHETWSRPRAKDDPQPANDPDASWGHAKRNAPGAKDCPFFGYYAQVATMVSDEVGPSVPELVRRIAFETPRLDPAGVMAKTLLRLGAEGVTLGDVLADCGYSNRDPNTFAVPLRSAGADLVMDLHPADRGRRGIFEGTVLANGCLFCPATPATPSALFDVGPLRRGATTEEVAAHDARCAELAYYRFSALSAPDHDGYQRVMCPATAGKVRCPLKPASLARPLDHPSVIEPPGEPPRCCAQQSITVPPQVNEKTRQKHDYPGPMFRASYARRTAAERTYASLADPSVGGIRRGWCRLFGLAKNTLMYALGVVVRNVRIVESFERRRAQGVRRSAIGPSRRRRRRYQREVPTPEETPVAQVPTAPG